MTSSNKIKKPVSEGIVKVPVVMQLETLECGAASLCMILAYFGRWIPLEQLRKECGVSRDGSNLRNIYLAAKKYKLKTKAFSSSAESLRESGTFPCIAFWNYNHFLVVDGFKRNHVYLNDPAGGELVISFDEFKKSYSGICMLFEPGEEFEPGGRPASIASFALSRMRGMSAAVIFVILTTVI
ncbi:MAG: hypothetical protein IJG55_00725, partial [Synergistaceae bacterium]|nr:hypothetical protein [Synergistaceae bacterium]